MKATINSIKHYIQTPALGVASGGIAIVDISVAVAKGAARANTFNVEEGSTIKAVYLEFWVKADNPNFTVNAAFLKMPASVASPTFAQMNNLQAYANKKNILEFHQGLAPSGDQVMALFRGWYKIPKGKQRQGLADVLRIVFSFTGSAGDICGMSTYKEYE